MTRGEMRERILKLLDDHDWQKPEHDVLAEKRGLRPNELLAELIQYDLCRGKDGVLLDPGVWCRT